MTAREISVGELRSTLQPIVFVELLEDVSPLKKYTYVAVQYWGKGNGTLTGFPAGPAVEAVAHPIRVREITADLMYKHNWRRQLASGE